MSALLADTMQLERLREQHRDIRRQIRFREAHDDLLTFTEVTMPDPEDPDDPLKTDYRSSLFHRSLANALQRVEQRLIPYLAICCPPRHGKSELSSRRLPAWFAGRHPSWHVMMGTYNETFAADFGRDVRNIMQSDRYGRIFPRARLQKGSAASDRMQTTLGGMLAFVGRGGSITGRGAHLMIVDDPLKNSEEADSPGIRDDLWRWFIRDVLSRRMNDRCPVIIIQTRWHEDDLVGRITDPKNPHYRADFAKQWHVINIPALAEANDPLGRQPGEPLWPEQFGRQYFLEYKAADPRGFSALYQQRPSPEEGTHFKQEMFVEYMPHQKPANLRLYVGSDHALGTKQQNDRTAIVLGGLDEDGVLWLDENCWWQRAQTHHVVEQMLSFQKQHHPMLWWTEDDHITRGMGPFLLKRMQETSTFISLKTLTAHADPMKKVSPFHARMAMGMVRWPAWAPWYHEARTELLNFPQGTHDDFVMGCAALGRGLAEMVSAAPPPTKQRGPVTGTLGWVKAASEQRKKFAERFSLRGGF